MENVKLTSKEVKGYNIEYLIGSSVIKWIQSVHGLNKEAAVKFIKGIAPDVSIVSIEEIR